MSNFRAPRQNSLQQRKTYIGEPIGQSLHKLIHYLLRWDGEKDKKDKRLMRNVVVERLLSCRRVLRSGHVVDTQYT